MGLFEDLHDFETAEKLASHLGAASKQYYGTPIRHFLEQIISGGFERVREQVAEIRARFVKETVSPDASGEVWRVADRFALLAAAGELAQTVTGWDVGEAYGATKAVFQNWLASRDTHTGHSDTEKGIAAVKRFLEAFGNSCFDNGEVEDEVLVRERFGFKKMNADGEVEFLILPQSFKDKVCKGFNQAAVVEELIKRGYLRRGSEAKTPCVKEKVPGLGRTRFYAIKESLIAGGDRDETAAEKEDLAVLSSSVIGESEIEVDIAW